MRHTRCALVTGVQTFALPILFVQTELVPERQAILCTRRARSQDEVPPWMFHLVAVHEADIEGISYETDRSRFIGRGRDARTPRALVEPGALSGSQGRSEEHTSELQSLMRNSYAVLCLKKKKK